MGSFEDLLKAQEVLEQSVSSAEVAAQNAQNFQNNQNKDWLPLFFLHDHDITVRLTMDLKKQLSHEFCQYSCKDVPVYDDATGEEKRMTVKYRVKGVWNEKLGMTDYSTEDPLLPMAKELGTSMGNSTNPYAPKVFVAVYADVIKIRKGDGQLGPCILLDRGKKRPFGVALNTAILTLMRQAEKKGNAVKDAVASTFDPTKPGITCDIRRTPGLSGSCLVTFDKDDHGHTFAPEFIEKFQDITTEYAMRFGASNNKNREILTEHFKRLLAGRSRPYAQPDPIRTRKTVISPEDNSFSLGALDAAQAAGR